jgi:hypothetical protein
MVSERTSHEAFGNLLREPVTVGDFYALQLAYMWFTVKGKSSTER